jgi:hypothetical protein
MPGAELQLAAYGKQDLHLTGNPQVTFFVAVYKRYTNFAIENIEEYFIGEPVFGGKSYIKLGGYGDLVSKMYLDIILPSLNPNNDPSFAISWVNSIGHALIKKIELEIGGEIIDTQYGIWMEIWDELTLPAEKRFGYYDMIGKHEYFNVTVQQEELHLRVPLKFWFCRNIGLSLPNIALQNSDIRIIVTFSKFDKLWVSSTGDLSPLEPCIANCKSCGKVCTLKEHFNIKKASLFVDYIYLEENERRWFVNNKHQYLIEQVQLNLVSINLTSIDNVIQLNFNHPVKELIWVIRDNFVFTKVKGGGNEWFNFSNKPYYLDLDPEDPMQEAILWLEGNYRFWPPREAKYFREVQPYKRHSNVPDNFIYVYSFSLKPEEFQPSGTCNFSRLDNVQLNVKVVEGLSDPEINIFGPNYNILVIADGLAGLMYGN